MTQPVPNTYVPDELLTDTLMNQDRDVARYLLGLSGSVLMTDNLELASAHTSTDLVLRNTTEGTNRGAAVQFATGAAEAALAGTNVLAALQGLITQATPSALKGAIQFFTNQGDSLLEAARLDGAGNLGIGTASIDERLHVAKASGAVAIQVENEDAGTNGDPSVKFAKAGAVEWSMGLDDSSHDNFAISIGTSLGTNNVIEAGSTTYGETTSYVKLIGKQGTGGDVFLLGGVVSTLLQCAGALMDFEIDADNDTSGDAFTFGCDNGTLLMALVDSGQLLLGAKGHVTLPNSSTTPANPGSSAECNIYQKGHKLVIQYNDAGTVRYKTLDLTGTGVTWVHSTSPP